MAEEETVHHVEEKVVLLQVHASTRMGTPTTTTATAAHPPILLIQVPTRLIRARSSTVMDLIHRRTSTTSNTARTTVLPAAAES